MPQLSVQAGSFAASRKCVRQEPHRHGSRQGNNSLVDMLNLIQKRVHAGLGGCITAALGSQVCDQIWQLVPVQLKGIST